ncbi:MAG: hypothetical protein WAK24_16720, partial [Candidatus Acidiferrales bacterium]
SLSAAPHYDSGNPPSSDTLEATGERKLILSILSLPMAPPPLFISDLTSPAVLDKYQDGWV